MSVARSIVHRLGRWYVQKTCASEFDRQSFKRHNERPVEYRFALQALSDERPKTVLDVGTGTTAWPALLRDCGFSVTAIDNVRDYWPDGMVNRHWTVLDVDILKPDGRLPETFDAITCISVIEHIEDHRRAVENMASLLNENGVLILTTPFSWTHPCPNVYKRTDALCGQNEPYICRSSSEDELAQWLDCGLVLERRELWRMFTGDVWATGQRCEWRMTEAHEPHQLGCFLFRRSRPGSAPSK